MTKNICSVCGSELDAKEIITMEIYGGDTLCDICLSKKRRAERAIEGYQKRLESVPHSYRNTKFDESVLIGNMGKSAIIEADESPVLGTQWVWDVIKVYWKSGQEAMYTSIKDLNIEYSSLPWQSKKEFIDKYMQYPGMLAIDDIDNNASKELLSRIVEHRAERNMDTQMVLHISYNELDLIIGEKAMSLLRPSWKRLTMERSDE